ncbi:hypothetical protein X797_007509 [Metarhizium robertsii]|uniref:Uncharacterized protein n=2 Tax=Metarhizium robertsii TaxID=568076 RepID=E9F5L9_METRA|nr:uncharacterized protein MAA_07568 [Metarhizium robertsii ARSEF 23]EFY97022.1 hypothetical protein MAA_07568 [Metarhizium robertsii ARSEF 23]EXU99373.1 hypothetical protein X797_007509 [Metarhizium robertsii]
MTTTLYIQESSADLKWLTHNNYSLQVAKSVSSPGAHSKPTFNVVYQSQKLAPSMNVSWTPQYGLNWTTQMPASGAQVVYSGNWQPCDLGQSYNLTSDGEWIINNDDPNKDSMSVNVGLNGYPGPVNIIVGILDPNTNIWQAIFVSPDQLSPRGFGQYQPRDDVEMWYEEGMRTETIILNQDTAIENFSMTGKALQYFWYSTNSGKWENSPDPFPFNSSK